MPRVDREETPDSRDFILASAENGERVGGTVESFDYTVELGMRLLQAAIVFLHRTHKLLERGLRDGSIKSGAVLLMMPAVECIQQV